MAMNKRKTTTAIVAGVTAVALLLGGTFAWTSISQQAKNETAGIVNVGGRLHDDFDGTNKDVYVENFTDPLNGGQPIYARVKLTEYMEVGKEAGQADNADRNAVPVVPGTNINDRDNWPAHIPAEYCNTCETGDTCLIHDHWTWEMGGQTTFMPTFNKDKDSLEADINGTYHGTNPDDKVYYDDYVVYTTDETGGVVNEADKEAYDGDIYSIIGTEIYDNDTDTEDNDGTRQVADVTHTAKETATATVITMADWLQNPVAGNFWVYDEDGWAYWANPIMPGESTGLLLDSIKMEKNPGEKCYYAINVVGQFATVGDWEYFDGELNDNVKELLTAASQNITTVTVSITDNTAPYNNNQTVNAGVEGNSVTFEATATLPTNAAAALAAEEFEWTVTTKDMTAPADGTTIDANGVLTVAADETADSLIVSAKHIDSGAIGICAIGVVNEIVITDDMSAQAYALRVENKDKEGAYDLVFVRSFTPDQGLNYQGAKIVDRYTDFENKSAAEEITNVDLPWVNAPVDGVYNYANYVNIHFANTIRPDTIKYWFYVDADTLDVTKLDTSNITDMYEAFRQSRIRHIIGIKNWDVSQVTTFEGMFSQCMSLKSLDLSGWDVSSATNMKMMIFENQSLESIDLSGWKNMNNVETMNGMFAGCTYLETIDLSGWDVSSVNDMDYMFSACFKLTLDCSSWDVTNVTSYSNFNDGADGVTPPNWVN